MEIIRASAWTGFAELVTSMGGNPDEIFAAAQLDPRRLADAERYLPLKQFTECLAIAADKLKRKDFGLALGQSQGLSLPGALSIAIMNAPTPRDAINIATRFMHVHNPSYVMTLAPMPRRESDFLSCVVTMRESSRRGQYDERLISNLHKNLAQLGEPNYRAGAVWFTHAPISTISVYRRVFGVTPLFNQPTMGIAIERSVLDAWRPGRSEQMRVIAETYLTQKSLPRETPVTQSVASMARSLLHGGEFTPQQAAAALGLHARTLQRRLREEGSSFEKIKDTARREWAESLLSQPSITLTQISDILGYADSSAFSRSCRRWFGEAPRSYRARLAARRAHTRTSRVNSFEANLRARRRADV